VPGQPSFFREISDHDEGDPPIVLLAFVCTIRVNRDIFSIANGVQPRRGYSRGCKIAAYGPGTLLGQLDIVFFGP